jgi:hypothetical protein
VQIAPSSSAHRCTSAALRRDDQPGQDSAAAEAITPSVTWTVGIESGAGEGVR